MTPHIRIFPHSHEEFSSADALAKWMLTDLKAKKGGKYLIVTAQSVAELPIGSIVLFRSGQVIVGEAMVTHPGLGREQIEDKTSSGKLQQYEASVSFLPGSIRLYEPPIAILELEKFVGESPKVSTGFQTKFKIEDWDWYHKMLTYHVDKARGTFI